MPACIFFRDIDGIREYWTGEVDFGEPVVSPHRCDAMGFTGQTQQQARDAALQSAATHVWLRNSEFWKVVKR